MPGLPKWLTNSYNSMDSRWGDQSLDLFIRSSATGADVVQIVLLQHSSEMNKKTGTGWLLDDQMFFERFPHDTCGGSQLNNVQLQRWIWSGREDASKIEKNIEEVAKGRDVRLLWTDSAKQVPDDSSKPKMRPETYIILDGTWQQAKSMYRKIPALWKLPRVALDSAPPSTYVLRGDYGWKERFGNDDMDDKNLLCTAEVAAAVMDMCGDAASARGIRERLEMFQSSFTNRNRTSGVE